MHLQVLLIKSLREKVKSVRSKYEEGYIEITVILSIAKNLRMHASMQCRFFAVFRIAFLRG